MLMIQVKITKNDQNKRLDNFIRKYLNQAPLSYIYKLFRKKDIKVNKKPAKPDYITKLDDEITIYVKEESLHEIKEIKNTNKKEFDIIYEDENILIVNKPINLLVHEGNDDNEDTLINQVINYLIETKQYNPNVENGFVPALAHRIDRNTSGLVVIGKTNLALQELFEAFSNHENVKKQYLCLVAGIIKEDGIVEAPLKKDENKKLVFVDKNGLYAKTIYHVLQSYDDCSLLEIQLVTGRTHQIRVHMNYIHHPLLGDKKYGNEMADKLAKKYKLKNYFLHAKQITFTNFSKTLAYLNNKTFVAPLYEWQKQLLDRLNKEE